MDVWYHNENTYPFMPQEVLDRADSVRASLPNKYCDPKIAADLFEEVLDEFMLCDDQGLNVVAIASCRDQLPLRGQPADSWHPGPPDTKGPHPEPGNADLAAAGPRPCRRGVCHGGCDLPRAPRDRLRQVRRKRDGVQQCQPGQ
jgi:hypothetical protein